MDECTHTGKPVRCKFCLLAQLDFLGLFFLLLLLYFTAGSFWHLSKSVKTKRFNTYKTNIPAWLPQKRHNTSTTNNGFFLLIFPRDELALILLREREGEMRWVPNFPIRPWLSATTKGTFSPSFVASTFWAGGLPDNFEKEASIYRAKTTP